MTRKKFYSIHPVTGELVGEGYPDPSPLEPDVFLYPASTTTVKPPFPQGGKALVFRGDAWGYVEDHRGEVWYKGTTPYIIMDLGPINTDDLSPEPVSPPDPNRDEPDPEEMTLTEFSADLRWKLEVAGTMWNGWPVHTDRESQSKILMEVTAISVGFRQDGAKWKFKDGVFRPLTNEEFMALTNAVRQYIVDLFDREDFILQYIKAGEITTREQVEDAYAAVEN